MGFLEKNGDRFCNDLLIVLQESRYGIHICDEIKQNESELQKMKASF